MKKKPQPGPIIEQRRFEFDGHCFYVPLKIAINVRLDNASRAKLGKRRAHGKKRGKNHELKRCRPTNYWSFPAKPAPQPPELVIPDWLLKIDPNVMGPLIRQYTASLVAAPAMFKTSEEDMDLIKANLMARLNSTRASHYYQNNQ